MNQMRLAIRPLEDSRLRLEPYSDPLRAELQAALDCDPDAWALFATCGAGEHFDRWWAISIHQMERGLRIPFAVRDLASGRIVGTTSLLDIRAGHRGAEIGSTFLRPEVRSGYVNPASKRLLLDFAFGCGAVRIELVTDRRNLRSQAAIAKLGAVHEGILRKERITWTGHVRDSVIYSITDEEWPAVRARLDARLAT